MLHSFIHYLLQYLKSNSIRRETLAMQKKRNSMNAMISTDGYIQKYFGTDIKRILVPNDRNIQNCDIPYVSHSQAEGVLKECLVGDNEKDKSLVFTGLTGSGKTTILRHVFDIEKNGNSPRFRERTIVIPVDFNRSQKSAQDAILSSLRFAVKKICKTYGIDYPDLENQQFYEYIEERRGDFLELNPKHGRSTSFQERMITFLETMPPTFASCQLQYVMDNPACSLELVVLVVDNIEAFMVSNATSPQARYLAPVIEAFKLAECIGQRSNPTKWSFNMVIACRHHIWRIMKGEFSDNSPENALLQSYVTTETPYDLINPVKVDQIIKKREEVFSKRQRDIEKWNTAVNVVNTVLQTMESNIGDFILQIELKDLRKSLAKMQELVLNKGLQKMSDEQIVAGAFQIDSVEQFDLTRVNIIKTIGLGNRKYYSDESSIIPNLLYNNSKGELELYPLLTLNYFMILCSYSEPSWDNPVSISGFYRAIEVIFEGEYSNLTDLFQNSLYYLIKHRLLLRSADQPQDEIPGLSLEDIKKVENVYVSGSALTLWRELGKSSALFQLFLDDVWLNEKSDYFGDNGNDIEHCAKYLKILFEVEKRIYGMARNLSAKCGKYYLDNFGRASICKHLANGLIASLSAIRSSSDSRSQGRALIAKETLRQVNELSNAVKEWERDRYNEVSGL